MSNIQQFYTILKAWSSQSIYLVSSVNFMKSSHQFNLESCMIIQRKIDAMLKCPGLSCERGHGKTLRNSSFTQMIKGIQPTGQIFIQMLKVFLGDLFHRRPDIIHVMCPGLCDTMKGESFSFPTGFVLLLQDLSYSINVSCSYCRSSTIYTIHIFSIL